MAAHEIIQQLAISKVEQPPVELWILGPVAMVIGAKIIEQTVIHGGNAVGKLNDRWRPANEPEGSEFDHQHLRTLADPTYNRHPQTREEAEEYDAFTAWDKYLADNPDLAADLGR